MTSPKEVLITAKVCIEGENTTLFQKEALGKIQAAIPVAELHQQAVDKLKHVTSALDHCIKFAGTRTFLIKQKAAFLDLMTEARELSAKIEALP